MASKTFSNNKKGFSQLIQWTEKLFSDQVKILYAMEATGVYHEALAYYLSDRGDLVSIILPNKISNYVRTLDVKTITDKSASQAITRFGLERKLEIWQRPKKVFKDLRQLTRERDQLIGERTMLKNQLHAELAEAFPNERSISRVNERITLLNRQEKDIKAELAELIKNDPQLVKQVKTITSIPGIGTLTAVTVLAETNGFELIRSKKQLVSYAGLDVQEKQSGTSVKGKPRISKKGNKHLRKAMHLPALAAIRNDERFRAVFARLIAKHGIKMKAIVAIQRKLLELTYIIAKTGQFYDIGYLHKAIDNTILKS
ncbi:IS110 family transposase [Mucilaginibacter jinjuensis]|uniref:IS110 family transposase n=1 Tax=Mucilaginibacter jinjuensis TaxID=1176721 RepID=A0ABY7TEX6_9SPHI|nr:IS110 family transposase [Mucilaginibacter jinjuensis]WCT15080.1 IS110 family transposase [Mucilaginibacter jinjuensis]